MASTFDSTQHPQVSSYRNTALTNTKIQVKSGPNRILFVNMENPNASKVYLHIYDALAADVTVGTTVPKRSLFIPATGAYDLPLGFPMLNETGLTIAVTTGADTSTAPGAACLINMDYQ